MANLVSTWFDSEYRFYEGAVYYEMEREGGIRNARYPEVPLIEVQAVEFIEPQFKCHGAVGGAGGVGEDAAHLVDGSHRGRGEGARPERFHEGVDGRHALSLAIVFAEMAASCRCVLSVSVGKGCAMGI